ncbi:nucleotidyl transferase AbiEii/AbiGii toxin family protein [Turicimonas sp. TL08]
MKDGKELHEKIMISYLLLLNKQTDQFILKGGTALSRCYGLDRFSEDIDLDGHKQDIKELTRRFCDRFGFTMRVAKDTSTVKRCLIDYGGLEKPLKIEVSYRNQQISEQDWQIVGGIKVYSIDALARMKANAYNGRDKIRDLYDLSFICNNYFDKLSHGTKNTIRDVLSYKGIEQFDYLVATQKDPLIDKNKLADSFLTMHDKLGLLLDNAQEKNKLEQNR